MASLFWFKESYGISLEKFCAWFGVYPPRVKEYLEDPTNVNVFNRKLIEAGFKALVEVRDEYDCKHGDGTFAEVSSHIPSWYNHETRKVKYAAMIKYYTYLLEEES